MLRPDGLEERPTMPTSILMPSLSPTMEEGVLTKWLVKEGDLIKQGIMLCSVETDKTTVDYESMDEGYLRKIVVPDGSQAKVNQLIAVLSDEKDEDITEYLKKALEKSAAVVSATPGPSTDSTGSPQASSGTGMILYRFNCMQSYDIHAFRYRPAIHSVSIP